MDGAGRIYELEVDVWGRRVGGIPNPGACVASSRPFLIERTIACPALAFSARTWSTR